MATNPSPTPGPRKVGLGLKLFYLLPVIGVVAIWGAVLWKRVAHPGLPVRQISTTPFASVPIDGLTVNLFTGGDQLRATGNDLFLEFRDGHSNLVDVGQARFEMKLTMPGTVMHSIGKVFRTATPGQYRSSVQPQIGGTWTATIGFSGPHGAAEANLPVTVK